MVHFKVNGHAQTFDGDPDMPLLWYLRDILGLTGTKFGCGMALCGACTVLQNGKAIRSCSTPMSTVDGQRSRPSKASRATGRIAVQKAWAEVNVPQCGYCQPGRSCRPCPCSRRSRKPTDDDIDSVWRAIFAAAEPTSASGPRFKTAAKETA